MNFTLNRKTSIKEYKCFGIYYPKYSSDPILVLIYEEYQQVSQNGKISKKQKG